MSDLTSIDNLYFYKKDRGNDIQYVVQSCLNDCKKRMEEGDQKRDCVRFLIECENSCLNYKPLLESQKLLTNCNQNEDCYKQFCIPSLSDNCEIPHLKRMSETELSHKKDNQNNSDKKDTKKVGTKNFPISKSSSRKKKFILERVLEIFFVLSFLAMISGLFYVAHKTYKKTVVVMNPVFEQDFIRIPR